MSDETPTPRTDAKDKKLADELPSTRYREMIYLARQLERENAELLSLLNEICPDEITFRQSVGARRVRAAISKAEGRTA